jgi:hypothetical protein
MHIGRLPMDSWFLIGIEWKIEVILIEISLIKLAKISRKIKKFSQIYYLYKRTLIKQPESDFNIRL